MVDQSWKKYTFGDAVVIKGDLLDVLPLVKENSIDSCVTDPPYGLEFMGKEWDKLDASIDAGTQYASGSDRFKNSPNPPRFGGYHGKQQEHARLMQEWHRRWAPELLRVLKPGAHALVFGGTRTFHRLTCALEDAGFEIRDCLCWLYGTGMPKAKTLLKPGWEPIILARKPLIGTVAHNVAEHGTGALNIDGCRVEGRPDAPGTTPPSTGERNALAGPPPRVDYERPDRRWPANVILDEAAAELLDEQTGVLTSGTGAVKRRSSADEKGNQGSAYGAENRPAGTPMIEYGDSGGASRFFYCAKASRKERETGCELLAPLLGRRRGNHHPTVKPIALMRWLIRLVAPPNGVVIDPFAGSGSTGVAALQEGFKPRLIEREPEYVEIINARIQHCLEGKE